MGCQYDGNVAEGNWQSRLTRSLGRSSEMRLGWRVVNDLLRCIGRSCKTGKINNQKTAKQKREERDTRKPTARHGELRGHGDGLYGPAPLRRLRGVLQRALNVCMNRRSGGLSSHRERSSNKRNPGSLGKDLLARTEEVVQSGQCPFKPVSARGSRKLQSGVPVVPGSCSLVLMQSPHDVRAVGDRFWFLGSANLYSGQIALFTTLNPRRTHPGLGPGSLRFSATTL